MAQARKGKMNRVAEVAERVEKVRKELGLSQDALAEKFKVSRPRVSEWESGKPEFKPSTEVLMRLARLAPGFDDKVFFWEQAGLDKEQMLRAAAEELKVDPGDVLAAVLRKLADETRAGLASALGRLPSNAELYVVDAEKARGSVFSEGDIFLLEPAADQQDPSKFWRQVVLLEFPTQKPTGNSYSEQVRPTGLFMGRLLYKTYAFDHPSLSYHATVGPFNDSETKWRAGDGSIPIGRWGHDGPLEKPEPGSKRARAQEELEKAGAHYKAESDRAYKVHLPPEQRGGAITRPPSLERAGQLLSEAQDRVRAAEAEEMRQAEEEAKLQAPEKVRLYPEVRLIGGVIAWFAAPKERR